MVVRAHGGVVALRGVGVGPFSVVEKPAADHQPCPPLACFAVDHSHIIIALREESLHITAQLLNQLKDGGVVVVEGEDSCDGRGEGVSVYSCVCVRACVRACVYVCVCVHTDAVIELCGVVSALRAEVVDLELLYSGRQRTSAVDQAYHTQEK